ncbi:MAG: acyl transferase [Flavobacteriaceae bacterium]
MMHLDKIFTIKTPSEFESVALEVFRHQYENNSIYRAFCGHLGKSVAQVNHLKEIPFLPIEFFKTKKIISSNQLPRCKHHSIKPTGGNKNHDIVFTSSGTSGSRLSKHYVLDLQLYEKSYSKAFEHFYGDISAYCVLALLPSYLERKGSSLIYMMNDFISQSKHSQSGFYLHDIKALAEKITALDANGTKILLMGVSFALLDMVEGIKMRLKNTIVMETGGMKGRRKEMIRSVLHQNLKKGFGVATIHSEYGMTELLTQAYSQGKGIFKSPPWMKVLTRDTQDPLAFQANRKTGGLNIIDLANINSCAFIATQDLGKVFADDSFEVLGRFDHSDVRGCNLMAL